MTREAYTTSDLALAADYNELICWAYTRDLSYIRFTRERIFSLMFDSNA